jgi:hypothetical protein
VVSHHHAHSNTVLKSSNVGCVCVCCAQAGAYLPGVYEIIVDTVQPLVLTDRKAIHLRAAATFTDEYGIQVRNTVCV